MAYSDKVLDHYNHPRNVGALDKSSVLYGDYAKWKEQRGEHPLRDIERTSFASAIRDSQPGHR